MTTPAAHDDRIGNGGYNGGNNGSKTSGIGARLRRKEDDRFLRGRGDYVANLRMVGMRDVAFVRSPLAHARIRGIEKPEGLADAVFTLFEKMVAQGRTILMVTHDNDLARRVQRAVHVSDGRIVSDHG